MYRNCFSQETMRVSILLTVKPLIIGTVSVCYWIDFDEFVYRFVLWLWRGTYATLAKIKLEGDEIQTSSARHKFYDKPGKTAGKS